MPGLLWQRLVLGRLSPRAQARRRHRAGLGIRLRLRRGDLRSGDRVPGLLRQRLVLGRLRQHPRRWAAAPRRLLRGRRRLLHADAWRAMSRGQRGRWRSRPEPGLQRRVVLRARSGLALLLCWDGDMHPEHLRGLLPPTHHPRRRRPGLRARSGLLHQHLRLTRLAPAVLVADGGWIEGSWRRELVPVAVRYWHSAAIASGDHATTVPVQPRLAGPVRPSSKPPSDYGEQVVKGRAGVTLG